MKRSVFLLLSCFLLSGCFVQSLNKFYTDDLRVELPQISGEWVSLTQDGHDVSDKNITPWKFIGGEKSDLDAIETYDASNVYSELKVAYFKIGDNLFMDYTAGETSKQKNSTEPGNMFWRSGVTTTHSVCKVIFEKDKLIIIPINYAWVADRIEKKTMNLSFIQADKNSNYIFTATPEQWVSFLKTYGSDNNVFSEKGKFVFKRG